MGLSGSRGRTSRGSPEQTRQSHHAYEAEACIPETRAERTPSQILALIGFHTDEQSRIKKCIKTCQQSKCSGNSNSTPRDDSLECKALAFFDDHTDRSAYDHTTTFLSHESALFSAHDEQINYTTQSYIV